MAALSQKQLEEFDALLARQEEELAQAVHSTRDDFATPGGHGWPEVKDSVDDGDSRMMDSLDLMQLQRNETSLLEVREARQRIREDRYGDCDECGKPIGPERLKVLPTTRYCVQDEERRERAAASNR
jgi:DnaK suppressor protein